MSTRYGVCECKWRCTRKYKWRCTYTDMNTEMRLLVSFVLKLFNYLPTGCNGRLISTIPGKVCSSCALNWKEKASGNRCDIKSSAHTRIRSEKCGSINLRHPSINCRYAPAIFGDRNKQLVMEALAAIRTDFWKYLNKFSNKQAIGRETKTLSYPHLRLPSSVWE